jgi:hypothetical protein
MKRDKGIIRKITDRQEDRGRHNQKGRKRGMEVE